MEDTQTGAARTEICFNAMYDAQPATLSTMATPPVAVTQDTPQNPSRNADPAHEC